MATKKTGQRPRRDIPEIVKRDWNTVRLLSETLRRAKPEPLSESMRRQIPAIAKLALMERRRNRHVIQPRIKELAKASGIEVRMARKNLRALEAWGFIIPKAFKNGGLRQWKVDGDALFRALVVFRCNPSDELRRGLRLLYPVSSGESFDALRLIHTPAIHPGTDPGTDPGTRPQQTPALDQDLVHKNQRLDQNDTVPDADFHHTPALTPALDTENAARFHMVNDKQSAAESALPSNCEPSRARISLSSLAVPVEADGRAGHEEELKLEGSLVAAPVDAGLAGQMDESQTSTCESAAVCHPLFTGEGFADQIVAGQGIAARCDALNHDARTLLTHLERSGPSTYGAAASDLGWGNTRAWQAEAKLQAAGAIRHDPIGRMVPTQRHREALLLPDTFHERNIP